MILFAISIFTHGINIMCLINKIMINRYDFNIGKTLLWLTTEQEKIKKIYNDGRKIDYFEHKIWNKLLLVYLVF